ncbi:MAG TPA: RES domain-containing protein [Thermoanaerobaculia bacterium]|nr:RES domain-containing protein [Thermoanaerobaculia bacterium]
MELWRLCRRRHAAFDGEGARRAGGRWNRKGEAVVYASESLSLAALELLVHCDPALLPPDLVAIRAEVPEGVAIRRVEEKDLPRGWRAYPPPANLAEIGAAWIARGDTAVLTVPSCLVPRERNALLNPAHGDFRRIRVGRPEPFSLDPRLGPRRASARPE